MSLPLSICRSVILPLGFERASCAQQYIPYLAYWLSVKCKLSTERWLLISLPLSHTYNSSFPLDAVQYCTAIEWKIKQCEQFNSLSPPKQYSSLIQLISMTSFFLTDFQIHCLCCLKLRHPLDQSMDTRWIVPVSQYHISTAFSPSHLELFSFYCWKEFSSMCTQNMRLSQKIWNHPNSMLHQQFNPLPFDSILFHCV